MSTYIKLSNPAAKKTQKAYAKLKGAPTLDGAALWRGALFSSLFTVIFHLEKRQILTGRQKRNPRGAYLEAIRLGKVS